MVTRAEHRRNTLRALGDAAIDLFETAGPDATIEAIGARAGISVRTVTRYVSCKEELAFVHPLIWLDLFDESLAGQPVGPLGVRLRAAAGDVAAFVDADPAPPRRATLAAANEPNLAKGIVFVSRKWIDRIAQEIHESTAGDPDPFWTQATSAAVMGVLEATTQVWAQSEPQRSFSELFNTGFDYIEQLL